MADTTLPEYDAIPYVSRPFAQTHPDRLASIATLFGMQPPPIDRCRVLELGCGIGDNIIPMAQSLPGSTFVGIDLSRRQIADGQAIVKALDLRNLELRHANILEVDASWGTFDYIIAHGIYSWVPPEVQDGLLRLCSAQLAPQGVAYVSYNTYPGWRMRGLIRDLMVYHARRFPELTAKVREARTLLDFMALAVPKDNSAYTLLLQEEVQHLRKQSDSYLLHEHLSPDNEPLFFHQFVERISARQLQYLGEAQPAALGLTGVAADVEASLRRLSPDLTHLEQYTDYLRNRMFRASLVVHEGIALNRELHGAQLLGFCVSSRCRPTSPKPDLTSAAIEEFEHPSTLKLRTPDPLMKAAMTCLAEAWPQALAFPELRAAARARLGVASPSKELVDRDTSHLGERLLNCYLSELVELHLHTPVLVTAISARPMVSPLARLEAATKRAITNQWHQVVDVDEPTRQLLPSIDGQHDHAALLARLVELVEKGSLKIQLHGQPIRDPRVLQQALSECLAEVLRRLARNALLIG